MAVHILRCWQPSCPATFRTFTELSTHHLEQHERPLPAGPVEPWAPQPRTTRWERPALKVLAMQTWYANGTKETA